MNTGVSDPFAAEIKEPTIRERRDESALELTHASGRDPSDESDRASQARDYVKFGYKRAR